MNMVAVTNNILIFETMSDKGIFDVIEYSECSFLDVLLAAKGKIRNGFVLLTHPFIGGSIPCEQPYKTLALLDSNEAIDFNSLKTITYAVAETKALIERRPQSMWTKEDLLDFRKIDLVVMERWLRKVCYRADAF